MHCLLLLAASASATAAGAAGAAGPPATCSMHILNETSCTAKAFQWTNETDAGACCSTCQGLPSCTAWEWWDATLGSRDARKGNCHLKETPGGVPFDITLLR